MDDQRTMLRARTVEEISDRWAQALHNHNLDMRAPAGLPPLSLVPDGRVVAAYANHGRWVADCPECGGGIACWSENPTGCCLDCFHVFDVDFPDEAEAIAAALAARPRPNRNWTPGETADNLHAENLLVGGIARDLG